MSVAVRGDEKIGEATLQEYLAGFCYDDYYFPMDGAFQNYTYFPRASLEDVRSAWKKTASLIRNGKAPAEIGMYVHWPFCISKCTFCFCSMTVPRSRKEPDGYLKGLLKEIDAFADIFEGIRFGSLWLGGGTPTFMAAGQLDSLLARIREKYDFLPGAQIYTESSPATLDEEKVAILAEHGVNRITLGVQSLDAGVLKNVDRKGQDRSGSEKALDLVRRKGMLVDMDMMFGLEGQSRVSFVRDLVWALKQKPEVFHVFAFDPKPQTDFIRAGKPLAPEHDREMAHWMALADKLIRDSGYRMSRLDPETLLPDCPEERQDSALRRDGASVLGLGASAVSHAFGSAWYCHELTAQRGKNGSGKIPPFRLMKSDLNEEMRGYALRNLSLYGRLSRPGFVERFGIDPMEARGLSSGLASLESSEHLRIGQREIVYIGRDPVERGVVLKKLYSPAVLKAIMKGRKQDFMRYTREQEGRRGGWPAVITEKIARRQLFRVYFKNS